MPDREGRFLTLREIADLLGVSLRTVRRLIDQGELKRIDVGAGSSAQWRVSEAEVRRFIQRRSEG